MAVGSVILAGAGPGDPGLLTLATVEAIGRADVVLYDRLIPQEALTHARADAELVDVGKTGGGRQVPQDETNRLIVEHAMAGRTVLRLKGGDPFVFGRGGEEALVCRQNGIPFTVIPGVTSGIAAPAHAGIPVTHRGTATAVAFITGHEAPVKSDSQNDWKALAGFPGTLVSYMGVRSLPAITAALIAAGRAPDEPAAVIERGTLPAQRTVHGTLGTIAEVAAERQVAAPAIVVIGDVAALGEQLAWRETGPLAGRTVVVTRPRAQASRLTAMLAAEGARVIEAPVIEPEALAFDAPQSLSRYELVVFSSPNGVASFFAALARSGRDARALGSAQVAVIGPGTAAALREHGVIADLVPERAVGESLLDMVADRGFSTALVVRALGGRTTVEDGLRAASTEVEVAEPYRTVHRPLDPETIEQIVRADWATFTSASSVRALCEAAGGAEHLAGAGVRLASIGPITSAELRAHGLQPAIEAAEHTPAGLVAALAAMA